MTDDAVNALEARIRQLEARVYGPFPAFVTDNVDPEARGRLQLQIPDVLGDEVSGWAEPAVPFHGTTGLGAWTVPPVTRDGDAFTTGVWVMFRGGDPAFPVWFGTFWGSPGEAVTLSQGNNTVRLDTQGITVTSADNSDTITLDSRGITVHASMARVSVVGQAEVAVSSAAKVSVSAPQVEVAGDGKVDISGGMVSITGSATVAIQGAAISLN